ncbi:carbon-nitrogen hydrolase family protein [Leucobacter sp. gxy201]|uniref:carbon-nitrogen hydrolase family protein n=1 Tax=Leucobacter sp. gxy201 TaxID=2957200 RepID=UPI003DA011C4
MPENSGSLTIACWQVASLRGDVAGNLAALERAAEHARDAGAELLITPEMHLTGYNIGDGIGTLAARQPLEGVRDIARRVGIAIIAGGPERLPESSVDSQNGVANSAWLVDSDGTVLSRHRKLQLFGELDRAHFTAGHEPITLAEYRGFRIATLICFDVEYPETTRAAALAGADLIAVPTAQMTPFQFVNEHVIRVRAWENSAYVAYVNQIGADGDFDYVGRSVIADPFGHHLAEAPAAEEALVLATLDHGTLHRAREQNPYLVELRRDLF